MRFKDAIDAFIVAQDQLSLENSRRPVNIDRAERLAEKSAKLRGLAIKRAWEAPSLDALRFGVKEGISLFGKGLRREAAMLIKTCLVMRDAAYPDAPLQIDIERVSVGGWNGYRSGIRPEFYDSLGWA